MHIRSKALCVQSITEGLIPKYYWGITIFAVSPFWDHISDWSNQIKSKPTLKHRTLSQSIMDTSDHGGGNVLKSDAELSSLIRRLDTITKYKSFQKWKTNFLTRLDQFLYDAGKDPAKRASQKFDLSLTKNVKQLMKVQHFMDDGDLSSNKKSVKASLALQELCNKLVVLNDEIEIIIPKSRAEEKQHGFTKFHLGAVLIEDGFTQYAKMEVIRDALEDIGTKLINVADRQQLDLFFYYKRQVIRFCDVMADLNLYEIMKKCIEFSHPPEEEESSTEEEPLLIEVVIHTYDGKTMRLELDPFETIGHIKNAISGAVGILPEEQILQYNGFMLNDNESTLEGAGVTQDGTELWLEPRSITLQIVMPDDETITHPLQVPLVDMKQDIQKRIEVQLPGNLLANQQVLTYQENNEPYPDDGQTVKDLKLQNDDVLHVAIQTIQVTINTYDGKTMRLELDPTESIGNVKDAIAPGSGIDVNEQVLQLKDITLNDDEEALQTVGIEDGSELWLEPTTVTVHVELPDGTIQPLMLTLTDTPLDIKERTEVQFGGIPIDEQILTYQGIELLEDDDTTVKDLQVQNGDILTLKRFEVPVVVHNTMNGSQYKLLINPKKRLEAIKTQMYEQESCGIPPENQDLFFGSNLLDDDTKPCCEYEIIAGTELELEPKTIKVNITDGTSKHIVNLKPRKDTCDDIKVKIEEMTGLIPKRQVLTHNDTELLASEDRVLKELGICDGDEIKVDIHKIPITVHTMDGKAICMDVDPTEPIGTEIKDRIVNESGIPATNQRLFNINDNDEEELEDDEKAAVDYSIVEPGTELYIEPKVISVTVEGLDGTMHTIPLAPKDTVLDIKNKIEARTGMLPKKQIVSYKDNELLNENTTVKNIGIREGDNLRVDVLKIPIIVNTMDGQKIGVMIDPSDPISEIKKQVQDEACVPADNQRLFMGGEELNDEKSPEEYGIKEGAELDMEPKSIKVKVEMRDGSAQIIDLTPSDTSDEIKRKIADKTGMIPPRQIVKAKLLDEELPNGGSTVKDMGIKEEDVLVVEVYEVPISVTDIDGKRIQLSIDPTDPIGEIKNIVSNKSGVPADNQKLFRHGDDEELRDDSKSAQECGIEAEAELDMEPKIINVVVDMPNGEPHAVELTPQDTSKVIKDKIEQATGMVAPRQAVSHNGSELPDDESTVKVMGIRECHNLKVGIYKIPLTVKTIDGKALNITVDPTEPVGNIKIQIENDSGVLANNQRLFIIGEELDDKKSVNDQGIEADSVLDMEPKAITVNVEMPNGETHHVLITPDDTAADVKEKIEKATSMAVPRQVLKHKLLDEELPTDGTTIKNMGIKEGDDLKVGIFKIPIKVKTIGLTIETIIDPTEPLGEVKKQLAAKSGVPPDNQRVFLNGEELEEESKPMTEYGVGAGSELDLEPKNINVNVIDMRDGKMHSIQLSLNDMSDDMKKKIEAKTDMAVPRQVVKHKGAELPTRTTVKDIGIREGDHLDVEIFKIPITINAMDGQRIEDVMIDPTQPISEIKSLIAVESGVSASNQRLFKYGEELEDEAKPAQGYGIEAGSELDMEPKTIRVNVKNPDGESRVVEITPVDTNDVIKGKIAKVTGIEQSRQVVMYKANEFPGDQVTAKEVGLREGDDLEIEFFKIPITVNNFDGNHVELMVEPIDTIGHIKKELQKEFGMQPSNQLLSKDDEAFHDDNKKANDCGIVSGTVLDLEPKLFSISVTMPDGKKQNIDLEFSNTPTKIKKRIENETGMKVPRQVLKFNGKEIPESQTAREAGIVPGDNLKVEIFKVPITVNTMDGKSFETMVDPTDQLNTIKGQIEIESGLLPSNQRVFLQSNELADDAKTARSYGIVGGSVLDVEPRSFTVNVVETPDGAIHKIDLSPRDKEEQVKDKIETEAGIVVSRQVVKFNDKVLPGFDNTVREMGMKEGSDLKVSIFKIPIVVKTSEGNFFPIEVEPIDTIETIKTLIEKETEILASKQILKYMEKDLESNTMTVQDYGIEANDQLTVDSSLDPIIFVDIKSETLFAVDREEVAKKGILTPNQGNKQDFNETVRDLKKKEELGKIMKEAPNLGISVQVVVEGIVVEDYDVAEAANVKNKFGVTLKKRAKNKKGEELIFVDPKTGSVGELQRKKYIDMGFITPTDPPKGRRAAAERREFIKEGETNPQKYDAYRDQIREIYGIALK